MSILKFIDKIDHGRPGVIIPIVFIALMLGIIKYRGCKIERRLYDNKVFSVGEIYDYHGLAKSQSTSFNCRFIVNGVEYTFSQIVYDVDYAYGRHFLGKTFPVIYEKGNPYNCELLILPENFQHINMPYPDSLKWVQKYN